MEPARGLAYRAFVGWKEDLETKLGSNAKAAAKLLVAWKKKAPKEVRLSKDSLATKIGELKRGETKWWKNKNRSALQAFATLLDVSEAELLGETTEDPNANLLPFPEFPALKPLAPNEDPCSLGKEGWLVHQVLDGRNGGPRWIVAPAGAGKTLTLTYLATRGFEGDVMLVRRLEESLVHGDPHRALVVEVTEAHPATDAAALKALGHRGAATVVLASFDPPIPKLQWWTGGDDFVMAAHGTGWQVSRATLPAGWRDQLLRWIDVRLEQADGDTKLIAGDVRRWLEQNDPDQKIVRTPGDLLALCDQIHLHGLEPARLSEMSEQWLVRALASLQTESPGMAEWLRSAGLEALRGMVKGHVDDTAHPLAGLDAASWEALVPTRSRSIQQTESAPGESLVVGLLAEGGLLRGTESGTLDVFPRWVRAGTIHAALLHSFESGSATAWGGLAADESRQAAVDDALDGLDDSVFRALVREVVGAFPEPPTLAAVAAIQTAFNAAGRRLMRDGFTPRDSDVPRWQRLAELQVRFLAVEIPRYGLHVPFSRPRGEGAWLAAAWSFSLRIPCPAGWSRPDLDWHLPGWSKSLTFETMPERLRDSVSFDGTESEQRHAVRTLEKLAVEVLERCKDDDLPEVLASAFVFAAAALSPRRGWRLRARHLSRIRHHRSQQAALVQALRQMSEEARTIQVAHLWTVILELAEQEDIGVVFQMFEREFKELLPLVLEHLSAKVFEETVRSRGFGTRPAVLSSLPRRLRAAAIRGWARPAEGEPPSFDRARSMLPALMAEDLDVVLEIMRDRDDDRGFVGDLAPLVWKHDPERARSEAERALLAEAPSAAGWYWSAPPAEYLDLIGLAEKAPHTPDWTQAWAQRRMLHAGRASEKLFALAWGVRAGNR